MYSTRSWSLPVKHSKCCTELLRFTAGAYESGYNHNGRFAASNWVNRKPVVSSWHLPGGSSRTDTLSLAIARLKVTFPSPTNPKYQCKKQCGLELCGVQYLLTFSLSKCSGMYVERLYTTPISWPSLKQCVSELHKRSQMCLQCRWGWNRRWWG